jgi:hypothetical protein
MSETGWLPGARFPGATRPGVGIISLGLKRVMGADRPTVAKPNTRADP